jgi:hypothetical protein
VREDRAAEALAALAPAIRAVEGEINREYRKLSNALALAKKTASVPEQVQTLLRLVKLVPDPTDPRHRIAVAELQRFGGYSEPST